MTKPVSPQDYFDLFQKMANPSGYQFQNLMFPIMDEKEIEKKISELTSVRHWLQTNLGLLDVSIKTLEYQRSMLSSAKSGSDAVAEVDTDAMNPAMWALNMMNQAGEQFKKAAAAMPKVEPEKTVKRTSRKK